MMMIDTSKITQKEFAEIIHRSCYWKTWYELGIHFKFKISHQIKWPDLIIWHLN